MRGKGIFRLLDIGATIHFQLYDENLASEEELEALEERSMYKCRLIDIEEDVFIVDEPINKEANIAASFQNGTRLAAWFLGSDQAVYTFETEIIGKKRGHIPSIIIKNPGKENFKRIQRRNFVRVNTTMDVAIHSMNNKFAPFTTYSTDLSAGGLAIMLPDEVNLEPKSEIICWFALHLQKEEIAYIRVICKVNRVFVKFHEKHKRASLEFLSIEEDDRQKIVKYCFEMQVAKKKKSDFR